MASIGIIASRTLPEREVKDDGERRFPASYAEGTEAWTSGVLVQSDDDGGFCGQEDPAISERDGLSSASSPWRDLLLCFIPEERGHVPDTLLFQDLIQLSFTP